MLGAEAFQEPPKSPADRAVNDRYRVPLIRQGQAYANHESQVNQVTAPNDGSGKAMPAPTGETRWGLHGWGQEQGPSSCRTEQGNARR